MWIRNSSNIISLTVPLSLLFIPTPQEVQAQTGSFKKTAFLGSFMKSTKHASMVLYRPSWCSEELCSNVAVRENCTYTYSQCSAPSWLSAVHEAAETKRFLWEQTCTWWGVTPSHSCICIFNQLESYKMYYKRLNVTSEEPSTFFLSWFVFVYLLSSLSPSFTLSLSLSVSPCSGTVSPLSGGHSSWCQQVRVWLAPPLTTSRVI